VIEKGVEKRQPLLCFVTELLSSGSTPASGSSALGALAIGTIR
jgi:hypothetical protein